MKKKISRFRQYQIAALTCCFLVCGELSAQIYKSPEGMVYGGAFIDRFKPAEFRGEPQSNVWGADNVIPRDVNNGLEDSKYSYWGGNIVVGDDGKNHMFVCRWPENVSKKNGTVSGHRLWWSSIVVHAVSDNPLGPYKVIEEIGKGHNPEIYRLKDGSYMIGVMGNHAYKAKSLKGPWTEIETSFDFLDLDKIQKQPGIREHDNRTNRTYVLREDGSIFMMNKTGYVFVSENGDEHFVQVSDRSAYPFLPEPAHLEDPVIWKDEVQYNLIVNDCIGRVALYLRSSDGINWKWEQGVAYDPTIMKHVDGTCEAWYKLERPKVRLDQYGRATHMNFAAIDTVKNSDVANDNHSSKNIVVPLTVQRRLSILNTEAITARTKKIELLIRSEEGFNAQKDVDVSSLKLGAPEAVNFGGGCKPVKTKKSGTDLIVIFKGKGNGIKEENFTAKLIGKEKNGELLFGYAKL